MLPMISDRRPADIEAFTATPNVLDHCDRAALSPANDQASARPTAAIVTRTIGMSTIWWMPASAEAATLKAALVRVALDSRESARAYADRRQAVDEASRLSGGILVGDRRSTAVEAPPPRA